jgi:hypothetical protein
VPGTDSLSGRYDRLLRWYPRWHRRERRIEMLTTYLDAADPDSTRPTRADVADVVLGGLRCRLRVRGAAARLTGVAVALLVGLLGSAAGTRISSYAGPPPESAAVAAAQTAIGERPADIPGPTIRCDFWCPEWNGDNVVSYDSPPDHTDVVAVSYDIPADRVPTVVAGARERLAAAGWHLSTSEGDDHQEGVRDGLEITVQSPRGPDTPTVTVLVAKTFSVSAVALAVLGLLVGALAGWLVHAWAVQRLRRHRAAVRLVVVPVCALLSAAVALITLATVNYAVLMTVEGGWTPKDVQLADFVLVLFPTATITLVATALALLALIATPPRGRTAVTARAR